MKKVFGTFLLLAAFALSGLNASAQTIPGLPTKTIADVAGTATSLTKLVGDKVGTLTGDQQKNTNTAITSLLTAFLRISLKLLSIKRLNTSKSAHL